MAKNKHVHQYRRATLGKDYLIYKCVLPGCTHYISADLIIGKKNKCWRCGDDHIISRKLAKPHCAKCTKGHEMVEEEIRPTEIASPTVSHHNAALDVLLGNVLDD